MKPINRVMLTVPKDSMYVSVWNATQNMNALNRLYYELLTSKKPIAFQSLAMQIGHSAFGHDDPEYCFEYGAKVILECRDIGLYEIKKSKGLSIHSKYQCEAEIMAELEKPDYSWKPVKWRRQGDNVILGRGNYHDGIQGMDVLNMLQSVKFELDPDILINFKDNKLFDTHQFEAISAGLLGKPFQFEWNYDKRGRSYSTGYDIQLQGNEYKKALISLHNKEVVTT